MRPLRSRLRHKITIQQKSSSQDSYGADDGTWSALFTRRASIQPVSGREYYTAKQTESENNVTFLIRHDNISETITTKHRISWNSRIFDIESIINVMERDKKLLITTREAT